MPYQRCLRCRLTVQASAVACPRCGGELVAAPVDPRAVRAALVKRGGRFRRTAPAPPAGRPSP